MTTRTVILEVEGLKLAGRLYLPAEGDQTPCPTVCICHGIPSGAPPDPSDGGYPLLAERICHQGLAVFIFNFRGTGTSGGNLDMLGWTRDLKATIDYLCTLPQVDRFHLSLLGFSGGAAVSVFVASQDERVSSVVACACPAEFTFLSKIGNPSSVIDRFRSIGAIRDKDFPSSVEEWINGFRLVSPIKYIAGIAPRPLLLVHGSGDDVVDVSRAYKLYVGAEEPKQIIIVDGVGHRLRQDDRAMAIVIDWLKSQCSN
ncbi:alpha/beta hydrolase [Chloroflexota bacterium]